MRQRVVVRQVLVQAGDELLHAAGGKAYAVIHSGVVHQAVDVAVLLLDLSYRRSAALCVLQLRLNEMARSSSRGLLAHEFVHVLRVPAEHDHARAFRQARPRNTAADACAAAGDDYQLVLQSQIHCFSFFTTLTRAVILTLSAATRSRREGTLLVLFSFTVLIHIRPL